jgi:hypothetical protein
VPEVNKCDGAKDMIGSGAEDVRRSKGATDGDIMPVANILPVDAKSKHDRKVADKENVRVAHTNVTGTFRHLVLYLLFPIVAMIPFLAWKKARVDGIIFGMTYGFILLMAVTLVAIRWLTLTPNW